MRASEEVTIRAGGTKGRVAVASVVIAACLMTAAPPMADADETVSLPFTVLREGAPIGRHQVSVTVEGERTVVEVDIDLAVKFGFLTVFRYKHENREVWRDGRLQSLTARTDDNGTEYFVRARAQADGLLVEGSSGRFVAPADIIPSSYWNPAILDQDRILDTQRGRILEVEIDRIGTERIEAGGRMVEADVYRMTGTLEVDMWYARDAWVKMAFSARGSDIEYVMDPLPGLPAFLASDDALPATQDR